MNERIRQLVEQVYGTQATEQEIKFAELIVKECIEQINKVEEKGDAHLGGGYFYDGTRLCRDAIKQHFGVEQ